MEQRDWFAYEKQAGQQGFVRICGIDEAGRGPLAGPVFAAAVILPQDCVIETVLKANGELASFGEALMRCRPC